MSTTYEPPDAEVIELEPTIHLELAEPAAPRGGGVVALVEGTLASLAGETHELRRRRIAAAAVFLAVAFGAMFLWSLLGGTVYSTWLVKASMALRSVIAASVAVVLVSRIALSRAQVKAAEYILFGSLVLLMAVNQSIVNLDLLRQGDLPGVIAFVKNGVFGTVLLMIIYGVLIPNDAVTTAKVVLTMALVQVGALVYVIEHPDVSDIVGQMRTTENAGSNVLFLAIGAGLAVYGSFLLNGLRSALHEARKFGQYKLVRKLGEGGMGEVYLAEHALLKRPCALKLIKPEASADTLALARFEREVQSSARLAHHNTIEIYDYGRTDDGTFYYVMEYLQGMSLADMVKACGPLPAGRVIYVMRQVCAGLAEAHGLGLVHRDLKPANVFLSILGGETDVAKVLDFGLVKPTKDPNAAALTADLTVSGTPLYMAPEQATGDRSLDARADIYALGAVMYHALTGQPPFQAESAFAVMMAHSRDPVTPPSAVRPDVPADLEQVVLRCLAKKPEDRYASSNALGEALAACACEWGQHRSGAWWEAHLGPGTSSPDAAG
jgi:serine/threonine-protein kinase